jgi:hypothetical protein
MLKKEKIMWIEISQSEYLRLQTQDLIVGDVEALEDSKGRYMTVTMLKNDEPFIMYMVRPTWKYTCYRWESGYGTC